MKITTISLSLFALCSSPALAGLHNSTTVAVQPGSPVAIERCQSLNFEVYNGLLTHRVDFRNVTTDKTIVAVRFTFRALDAFGESEGPVITGDDSGDTVSPGVLIKDKVQFESAINPWTDPKTVECGVSRVKFSDGTTWAQ